jgi:hypothetical protein
MRDETAAKRLQTAQDRDRMADDPDREAELRGRAVRDVIRDLTGAWVRKFGLPEVARELERAARVGAKLVLAFIDVDGLKALNDKVAAPDRVLHRGDALTNRGLFIGDPLEHDLDGSSRTAGSAFRASAGPWAADTSTSADGAFHLDLD